MKNKVGYLKWRVEFSLHGNTNEHLNGEFAKQLKSNAVPIEPIAELPSESHF